MKNDFLPDSARRCKHKQAKAARNRIAELELRTRKLEQELQKQRS